MIFNGPTGYFGRDKCETKGEWNGNVTFVETDAPKRTDVRSKRTDVRFDEMANEDHHSGLSALHPSDIDWTGIKFSHRLYVSRLLGSDVQALAMLVERSS